MITFHFLNIGQGNMAVGIFPNNEVLVYDCNITNENERAVFNYLARIMPKNSIDVFVNSHRDADHMRGIKKLNAKYPIIALWDSGVSGNIETPEYKEYMDFRRGVGYSEEVGPNRFWTAYPDLKIINGKRDGLEDPNSQSIVLHVNYNGSSLLLAGDTDIDVWRDYIVPELGNQLNSLVLFASHHGSHTFFNKDKENNDDFINHIALIQPAITIISVGENNPHDHPHNEALTHYNNYCYGANNGQKIFRTDQHKNMKLELHGQGRGWVYWNLF